MEQREGRLGGQDREGEDHIPSGAEEGVGHPLSGIQ